MSIAPATHVGAVHLIISDLQRSIRFYQSHVGFTLHRREEQTAWLGAGGADLLVLSQSESAPRVRGATGLYHFAILVPSRADLARALLRLVETETVMQGAADHGVSEALYLADPDGNGIEIYRDRPREQWPFVSVPAGGSAKAGLRMVADPLDLDALLAERDGQGGAGLAAATVIGHVHLHVASLADAERFYVGVLGFELTQRYGPSALFVAAGGYHHHVGLNTWAGVGAPPPPPGAIGLRHFEIVLPDAASLADLEQRIGEAAVAMDRTRDGIVVRDPSRNAIALVVR